MQNFHAEGTDNGGRPAELLTAEADRILRPASHPRPWLRYWARMLDILLFSLFGGTVAVAIYPELISLDDLLFGMLLIFAWVFVEALCLSIWGNTPGKAMFGIRLVRSDGRRISYGKALERSFGVWGAGLCLGIPLLAAITMITSYMRLVKQGVTRWDETTEFNVIHGEVGFLRTFFGIGLVLILLIISYSFSQPL
jgi:uncharacterized RDD family membrane protein YckC